MTKQRFKKLRTFGRRACTVALSMALAVGIIPAMNNVKVKAEDNQLGKEVYEEIASMSSKNPGSIFKPGYKEVDPYGYGVGQKFYLNTENELIFFDTLYESNVEVYENLKTSPLSDISNSLNKELRNQLLKDSKVTNDYGNPASDLNYVQMVSFDPTESGRKDHIAVIGVNDSKKLMLYVADLRHETKKWSKGFELGDVGWMGDNNNLDDEDTWKYNVSNFLSITAGDYNGDKKEELMIYGPYCNSNSNYLGNCGIDGVKVDENLNISFITGSVKHYKNLLHDEYTSDVEKKVTTDYKVLGVVTYAASTYASNRLNCKLGTGDLNGDGYDDLIVLSYVQYIYGTDDMQKNNSDLYFPQIKVRYGTREHDGWDISGGNCDAKDYCYTSINSDEANTMVAPGLDVGDVDGDHLDDIVIAGIYNKAPKGNEVVHVNKVMNINSKAESTVDSSKVFMGVFYGTTAKNLNSWTFETKNANNWTKGIDGTGGYYVTDKIKQQFGVKCFAVNGIGKPKMIFMNGSVYSIDIDSTSGKKSFKEEYTSDYFSHADIGSGSYIISNNFMESIAAGNFDGNAQGYEQIVFTAGLKHQSVNENTFVKGIIGGVYTNANGEKEDSAQGFYCTANDGDYKLVEDSRTKFVGDSLGSHYNYVVCAADVDKDGILASYNRKEYLFTDPSVRAVIQAAPYYNETAGYLSGAGETVYSIMESYNIEQTTTHNHSLGVGFAGAVTTDVVDIDLHAGYAREWTSEFTDGVETTHQLDFKATTEDQVVVSRTPVTIYVYDIDGGGELALSFPGKSSFKMLTLEKYNAFVDYYNMKLQESADEARALGETVKDSDIHKLKKLEDKYLGNEGNPYKYRNDFNDEDDDNIELLQNTVITLDAGTGEISSTWSKTQSHTDTTSISNGFDFEFEIKFGCKYAKGGAYVAISYMQSHAVSETKASGISLSASRPNYDPDKINASTSATLKNKIKDYFFDWKTAKWDTNLTYYAGKDKDNKDVFAVVPAFGYYLSGLKAPAPTVQDLKTEMRMDLEGKNNIVLSWTKPIIEGREEVKGYTIYQYELDGSRSKVADLDGTATEYTFTNTDGKDTYIFTIVTKTSMDSINEGLESDKVYRYIYDDLGVITSIRKGESEGLVDKYIITYSDGTTSYFTVTNGTSIVDISKTGTEGLVDTYTITLSDGSTTTFEVTNSSAGANGKSAYEIAVDNGFVGTEVEWLESLKGQDGKDGQNGKDGQDGKDGQNGQNGQNGSVVTGGSIGVDGIDGKDGKDGINGVNGANGLSAYEIAVNHGFVGTEEQWLESLKVVIVEKGESAYEIAVRNGFTGTEADWLESLKGQNGTDGKDGKDGANGSSYYGGGSTTVINGKDGVGIADVTLSANGDLVVTLSDGSKKVAGNILTSVDLDSYLKAKIDAITGADESEHYDGDDKDTDGTDEEPDVANVFFSKVSRPSSVAKALSLKWTKAADVDGYEIRYCLKKDFEKSKTVVVKASNSKKSYQKLTIKELKGARTYYVQIRSYVEENGKKYYSDWSDAVSKKTLKKVAAKAVSTT